MVCSDFVSRRYGNLEEISARTDGRCHLCHQEVDLGFYGLPGSFGSDTVTVDHLLPQAFGGDDYPENLRIAHAECNIARGTREYEDVRLAFAGTSRAPLDGTARAVLSIGAGAGGYEIGGRLFATTREDGTKEFNRVAGVITGLLMGLVAHQAL